MLCNRNTTNYYDNATLNPISFLDITAPASTSIAAEVEYIHQIADRMADSSSPSDMNEIKFICMSTLFHPELAKGKILLVVDEGSNPLFGIDPQSGSLLLDDLHSLTNSTREISVIGMNKKNQNQFFAMVNGERIMITGEHAVYKAIQMAAQQTTFQLTDIEGEQLRDELVRVVKEYHDNPAFLSLNAMIQDPLLKCDDGSDYDPALGRYLHNLAEQSNADKNSAGTFSFNPRMKEKGLFIYSLAMIFSGIDNLFNTAVSRILPWQGVSSHVIPYSRKPISSSDTAYAVVRDDVEKKKLFDFSCVEERDNIALSNILRQVGNSLKNPIDYLWKESAIVHSHNTLGIGCPSPEDVKSSENIAKVGDAVLSFISSSIPGYGAYLPVFQNFIGTGLIMIADEMENKPLRPELAEEASANLSTFVRIAFDKLPQAVKDVAKNNNNMASYPLPKGLGINSEGVYVETHGEKYDIKEEGGKFIGIKNNKEYDIVYMNEDESWRITEIENERFKDKVVCLRAKRTLDGICSPGVTYPDVSAEISERISNLNNQCREKIKRLEEGAVNGEVRYIENIIKNRPHYKGASIYTLADANQQTIDGTTVIDMNGSLIEIKETVIPQHGIRYDAPDNVAGISHPLNAISVGG